MVAPKNRTLLNNFLSQRSKKANEVSEANEVGEVQKLQKDIVQSENLTAIRCA